VSLLPGGSPPSSAISITMVNCDLKTLNAKCQGDTVRKFYTAGRSESCAETSSCPTVFQDILHPCAQRIHNVYATRLLVTE
jgi:hypothetical protein